MSFFYSRRYLDYTFTSGHKTWTKESITEVAEYCVWKTDHWDLLNQEEKDIQKIDLNNLKIITNLPNANLSDLAYILIPYSKRSERDKKFGYHIHNGKEVFIEKKKDYTIKYIVDKAKKIRLERGEKQSQNSDSTPKRNNIHTIEQWKKNNPNNVKIWDDTMKELNENTRRYLRKSKMTKKERLQERDRQQQEWKVWYNARQKRLQERDRQQQEWKVWYNARQKRLAERDRQKAEWKKWYNSKNKRHYNADPDFNLPFEWHNKRWKKDS